MQPFSRSKWGFLVFLLVSTQFASGDISTNVLLSKGPCTDYEHEIVNLTRTELLNAASKCVTSGFIHPIIARILFEGSPNWTTGPSEPLIKPGWATPLPRLTSRREAFHGALGLTELVQTGVHWFAWKEDSEDFHHMLKTYGLSAALHSDQHDPILRNGKSVERKRAYRFNSVTLQDPTLPTVSSAVRYAVAKRSSVDLPQQELSDEAVQFLQHIRQLLRQGDEHRVPNATRTFFRTFGTHFMPGPVLWGGAAIASMADVGWKQGGTNQTDDAMQRADCELREALQSLGIHLPCEGTASSNTAPRGSHPGASARPLKGGDKRTVLEEGRQSEEWLGSVAWSIQASSSWAVVDRGDPVPIFDLIHVDRDPELVRPIRSLLERTYMQLWAEANPLILHDASRRGDGEAVRLLVRTGVVKVGMRSEEGRTALHEAAEAGQLSTVHLLVQNGARVDATDKWRSTPLHLAAARGHVEVCVALLEYGADLLKVNGHGLTPLQLATATRSAQAEAVLRQRLDKYIDEL